MKAFSLFSGIGGFDLAMQRVGIEVVGACEIDKYARKTYAKNFGHVPEYKDARDIKPKELPDFQLLCAGFPCQPFSCASTERKGFKDTRGTLFFEIVRIAREKQPSILLLENVRGLVSHSNGKTFEIIIQTLDELGYDCSWQLISSEYFVPQSRKRIFIIGHLRGQGRRGILPLGQISRGNETTRKAIYARDECSSTLTATYWKGYGGGRPVIKEGDRYRRLTPLECERIQGFPDNWTEGVSNTQRWIQCGNAVTVDVVEYILNHFGENI